MSSRAINISGPRPETASGTLNFIFWLAIIALLPVCALFGGMKYLLLLLAIGLAVIVWNRPEEAPSAGMLFLFASGIVLPYGARFDIYGSIWEMYYWAAGLLLITTAALLRIGIKRIWAIPLPAKVFFLVAVIASAYGMAHGASTSYVLRQLYGALLLVAYLAIAMQTGDQPLLQRRILHFGVMSAICFLVYYVAVFNQYGFHKEMGFVGEQAAFLAAFLCIAGIEQRKRSMVIGALIILLIPALTFTRRDILTFLMALLILFVMSSRSTAARMAGYAATALVALSSLYPPVTEVVAEKLLTVPIVGSLIPEGGRDASSLLGRVAQLSVSLETVRTHPWFGGGMGGELDVADPTTGEVITSVFEDNGWGYLLQKMGLIGTAAFLWLLFAILQCSSSSSKALTACLISATVVTMFSQPAFLHFTTSPYMGTYAGLLLGRKFNKPKPH